MNISIIEAKPEHVAQIQDVFYRTWLNTYPNKEAGITVEDVEERFKDRHSPERLQKRREDLIKEDPNRRFLVALDQAKVIGLCRASKNDLENRVDAIYVLPEYQGKGVGGALWKEVQGFFDSSKDIYVGVATYNQNAISFYSKLGFMDTGKRYTEERHRMKSGVLLPQMEMRIARSQRAKSNQK